MNLEKTREIQMSFPVRVPVRFDAPGLPRPRALWKPFMSRERRGYQPMMLPVPWINGVEKCDFHTFREDAHRAHTERLCQTCGDPLNKRILLGAMGGGKNTSGPGCHPHCMRLAVNLCPHLREVGERADLPGRDDVVAWEYIGAGNGYFIVGLEEYESFQEWADASGWGGGEGIVSEAHPLSSADVAQIAKADPWGHEETYLRA